MPLKHRHPLTPNNATGNTTTSNRNPQNTFPKPPRLLHKKPRNSTTAHPPSVPSTSGRRISKPRQTPAHSASEQPDRKYYSRYPQASNPISETATLNTEKPRNSTTAHPPYVLFTFGQRQSMPLKHRHSLTPNNPTEKTTTLTANRKTLTKPLRYIHNIYRISTTAHPPNVPSTCGRRQSMPLKQWHPLMPNNSIVDTISFNLKPQNPFP
jgi:hypothetical protein